MSPKRETKRVIHSELIEDVIQQLNDYIAAMVPEVRREHERLAKNIVFRTLPDADHIDAGLDGFLRAALEDEIVPAVPVERVDEQPRIMEYELRQEVIKKALVGLKLPALREIARQSGIPQSGGSEDLATRIARYYKWNDEEIARLVLETESEPVPERGWIDRLFAMEGPPDLQLTAERLGYVIGRYIRIGVARWFVFERIIGEPSDGQLELVGTVRAYQAVVDEEVVEHPHLRPNQQSDRQVSVVLTEGLSVVRVVRAPASDSRAAMVALRMVTGWSQLGYVPVRIGVLSDETRQRFESSSLIMLDLITTRFRSAGIARLNLTMARFSIGQTQSRDAAEPDEESDRPRLKAVRFEGDYLLDSIEACRLIAVERRALVDISATAVSEPRPDGEVGVYPIRVALERDHIVVFTGFTAHGPLTAPAVHRQLWSAAVQEMQEGIANPEALETLLEKISTRAKSEIPPEHADIMNPEAP
ncbi:MAG TPA: hypothetical protein VFZ97_06000 [Acidimicrobiales bacterium]